MIGKKLTIIFYFLLFILILNFSSAQDNTTEFKNIFDIKDNPKWLNSEILDLAMDKDSLIIFSFLEDKCELSVSSFDKYRGQNAILSLKCGQAPIQPIQLKKGVPKKIDLDYDNKKDITLLLKNFEKNEDKFNLSIGKMLEEKENKLGQTLVIIGIFMLIIGGIIYFFYDKASKERYNKVKSMMENLENYLALKEHDEAKNIYNEVRSLYKKLTLKQQKELYDEIIGLFKQFEQEEADLEGLKL